MRIRLAVMMAATVLFGAAAQAGTPQEEANRKVVLEFYDTALNKKDAEAAARLLGPRYVQHNPVAQDGVEGFRAFINYLRTSAPANRSEVKRSFVDGDIVVLHVHQMREPNTRGRALVDIFRLEKGRIVEHWDVAQDIPEKPANTNTKF